MPAPIITRQFGPNAKGSKLSIEEMDENLLVLDAKAEHAEVVAQLALGKSRPYLVYSALLTQSGTSNVVTLDLGTAYPDPPPPPNINKGVTYLIFKNSQNYDFTTIGAPNNSEGTYFVANQTLLLEGVSGAILRYDEGAPVVTTVLENTIGNIWFTYGDEPGSYLINSDGLFIEGKTTVNPPMYILTNYLEAPNFPQYDFLYWRNTNEIGLKTLLSSNIGTWVGTNGILGNNLATNTPIEIRVYN